jgi:pimeloyl-ACP methyl ester carboxylesterase
VNDLPASDRPDLVLLDHHGRRLDTRSRAAAAGHPTVLFLPGYASDMDGAKAVAIDRFCAARQVGCLRLDYSGTGQSPGEFAEGTLTRWLDEVLTAIDLGVPDGPLIIAGSSMGGWLGVHAAQRRSDRVKGLLGIAAAPDFTDWGFTAEDRAALTEQGRVERQSPYGPEPAVTHRGFWQSGEALRLFGGPIDLPISVRLVHGELDQEVPLGVPLKLMELLHSGDVQLKIVKGSGHRLSAPHEIHAILYELHNLVELAR